MILSMVCEPVNKTNDQAEFYLKKLTSLRPIRLPQGGPARPKQSIYNRLPRRPVGSQKGA